MKFLVTGAAGFIGFHLSKRLIKDGHEVIGIDNFNNYYDPKLKKARSEYLLKLSKLNKNKFEIIEDDIINNVNLNKIFKKNKFDNVINLAAQAGVRYSIKNPSAYIQSNIVGFGNILEACKENNIKHLLYASSSSVYGGNRKIPFSEIDNVDHPVSLYAASKKANELMAHTYSHLFGLPTTGLRFFTVYGPWGRPDMALFLFTKNIIENKEIQVFNYGKMSRDFTYIDDIIESIVKIIFKIPTNNEKFDFINKSPSESWAPYKVFNIGNSNPINLLTYIEALEEILGKKANKKFVPIQAGDVPKTAADTSLLNKWIGYKPSTSIKNGINEFVRWYLDFYKIKV